LWELKHKGEKGFYSQKRSRSNIAGEKANKPKKETPPSLCSERCRQEEELGNVHEDKHAKRKGKGKGFQAFWAAYDRKKKEEQCTS